MAAVDWSIWWEATKGDAIIATYTVAGLAVVVGLYWGVKWIMQKGDNNVRQTPHSHDGAPL